MKKIFAKENEKFVKGIEYTVSSDSSGVKYVVDEKGNKIDSKLMCDLFAKGLLLISFLDGNNNKIYYSPFECMNHGSYSSVTVGYDPTSGAAIVLYSDGYTAG